MTLISMLLALIIERLAVRSDAWQSRRYSQTYLRLTSSSVLLKLTRHPLGLLLWMLLPAIIVTGIVCLVNNWLLTTVVNIVVLLLAIGCWHYRKLYKQYLNAQGRGDAEAAFIVMQQLRQQSGSALEQNSDGQLLVWLNFRYYAAVIFWFVVAGVFGVITYVMLRQLQEPATFTTDDTEDSDKLRSVYAPEADKKDVIYYAAYWADWFPARLFGLGLALVGHFSRASSALLGYFLDFTASNERVVTEVAAAAEPVPESERNTLDETRYMVQLAKRNILFFLAFTAILTLSGWLG